MTTQILGTYTRLKSGDWGVRIPVEIERGTERPITVQKKSGEIKCEHVKIIWSGNGVSLGAIQQDRTVRKTSYRPMPRRSDRCRGCGGPIRDAAHHRAMQGYCGHCAFDEFDC